MSKIISPGFGSSTRTQTIEGKFCSTPKFGGKSGIINPDEGYLNSTATPLQEEKNSTITMELENGDVYSTENVGSE